MKYNETLIAAAISIGLTITFSTLFGFAGSAVIGTFWGWFWISLLVLVVGFAVVNSYLIRRDSEIRHLIDTELATQTTNTSVRLACAYCQTPNVTSVLLNQRNTFKCESCNQVNNVNIQFLATALTSPIEGTKLYTESETLAEFKLQ